MTKPSQSNDIFIHAEGADQVAYQAGHEIARMTRVYKERFYVDLQVWVRKNGPRARWKIDEAGNARPATDVEAEITRLQKERDTVRWPDTDRA
jgi:hypothetical protein